MIADVSFFDAIHDVPIAALVAVITGLVILSVSGLSCYHVSLVGIGADLEM
jgi:hypothetical protein